MTEADIARQVADQQQISELIYRYCRSVDRIDPELGYTVWHEDGLADYGENIYQGTGRGVIDHICAQHSHCLAHSHQISNILINLNGDTAGSESYVTATLRVMNSDKLMQISVWSRYLDTWSRRDGKWGIDKRITLVDFDEIREVQPINQAGLDSRNQHDPSYAVLG